MTIGTSVRVLTAIEDTGYLLAGRLFERFARRMLPDYPRIPVALPPNWVPAIGVACGVDRSRGRGTPTRGTGAFRKEIADRLVISRKTVGNHIEHIYTKIGCSSRAEASLLAMQHGLLGELRAAQR